MAGALPRNRGNRSANRIGATVSRRLRAANWNISPAGRRYKEPGMFVSAQECDVSVLVDFELASKNLRVAAQIVDTVNGWDQVTGQVWTTQVSGGSVIIHFTYAPA